MDSASIRELGSLVVQALAYYTVVLLLTRFAGKRLAGQMTTFDLIVLIALATAAKDVALQGGGNRSIVVFILVVLVTHRCVAMLCARFPRLRRLLRGQPRALVRDGVVIDNALREEAVSDDELRAGLRKLGYARVEDVRLAVLEETGHISAVPRDAGPQVSQSDR